MSKLLNVKRYHCSSGWIDSSHDCLRFFLLTTLPGSWCCFCRIWVWSGLDMDEKILGVKLVGILFLFGVANAISAHGNPDLHETVNWLCWLAYTFTYTPQFNDVCHVCLFYSHYSWPFMSQAVEHVFTIQLLTLHYHSGSMYVYIYIHIHSSASHYSCLLEVHSTQ